MRIHASGVGGSFDQAMLKVQSDLQTKALHLSQAMVTEVAGHKIIDPDKQRVPNEMAATLEKMARDLGALVAPAEGHLYRVLVSVNDDGALSHAKIEVDLIRE